MSLSDWAKSGWLKAQTPTRDQIAKIFGVVDRDLEDSKQALAAHSFVSDQAAEQLSPAGAGSPARLTKTFGRIPMSDNALYQKLESVVDEDTFVSFVAALASDRADEMRKEKQEPSSRFGPGSVLAHEVRRSTPANPVPVSSRMKNAAAARRGIFRGLVVVSGL